MRRQRGAALATSLLFLVIMTLLGLAAMRSGTIGLRLSQNEGSRLDAQQNAQTLLEAISNRSAFLQVFPSGLIAEELGVAEESALSFDDDPDAVGLDRRAVLERQLGDRTPEVGLALTEIVGLVRKAMPLGTELAALRARASAPPATQDG